MSDKSYLQHRKAELEAIRRGHLDAARDYRNRADALRRDRDRPRDPTRAFEHRADCDRLAEAALRDATRAEREAENRLNELRGIERQLSEFR